MNIYFDTEFTGLHKDTTLISIGCISEDGRTFYAELDDYDKTQCDEWINENVIANLKFELPKGDEKKYYLATRTKDNPIGESIYKKYSVELQGNMNEVAVELDTWLLQFDTVQFVSDVCHYDFVLLIDLFGTAFDLPVQVSSVCYDINQDIAQYKGVSQNEAFDLSREELLEELSLKEIEGDKHNALYDAKVIKKIANAVSKHLV